jgi:Protein of unknown function (DUF3892)
VAPTRLRKCGEGIRVANPLAKPTEPLPTLAGRGTFILGLDGSPHQQGVSASTQVTTITVRIRCINKTDRTSPAERTKAIGGVNSEGTRWKLSIDDAILGVETGKYRFHVEQPPGHRVWVIVARSSSGRKYLKTEKDGEQPNNLLSLSECP